MIKKEMWSKFPPREFGSMAESSYVMVDRIYGPYRTLISPTETPSIYIKRLNKRKSSVSVGGGDEVPQWLF